MDAYPFTPAVAPAAEPTTLAWCFAFLQGRLCLPEADDGSLFVLPLQAFEPLTRTRHYLGRLQEHDCWALQVHEAPPGWHAVPLRSAMMQMPPAQMQLASRAAQVLEWDRAHRFCGVCGGTTEPKAEERSRVCTQCGHAAYPRISPAMMALVWRGRELLLARAPHFPGGMHSALAGFVEAGESLEDCVHREVAEEVGLRVKNLRYYGSQSWPFPHSLMLAFTAEWDGGEIVPQPGEIESAGWFDVDALPGIPPRFSVAGHLIRDTAQALRSQGL